MTGDFLVWFDEIETETWSIATSFQPSVLTKKTIEMFHFRGPVSVVGSPRLEIDAPATSEHKKDYPLAYEAFLAVKASKEAAKDEMFEAVVTSTSEVPLLEPTPEVPSLEPEIVEEK